MPFPPGCLLQLGGRHRTTLLDTMLTAERAKFVPVDAFGNYGHAVYLLLGLSQLECQSLARSMSSRSFAVTFIVVVGMLTVRCYICFFFLFRGQ